MTLSLHADPAHVLPIGVPIADSTPSARPRRVTHHGRGVTLVPLDPERHTPGLYRISHGTPEIEALWTYFACGPFESEDAMRAYLVVWFRLLRHYPGPPGPAAALQLPPRLTAESPRRCA